MTATEFKNKLREVKSFLIGKEIVMNLVTVSGGKTYKFNTLNSFGNMILELEKLNAGFSFVKVGNKLTERRIITESELIKWMNRGKWDKIYICASTLKY